jgi:hypothetical protein
MQVEARSCRRLRPVAVAAVVALVVIFLGCGGFGMGPKEDPKEVEARNRGETRNNLLYLVKSFHNFAATYNGKLAAHARYKDGKPLLSWRVTILPYLEEDKLFSEFKLDEPWDSPHNLKLLPRMPKVFATPGAKTDAPHSTCYQAVVGPAGPWVIPVDLRTSPAGFGGMALPRSFTPAGTSNVICLVETTPAVPWTKPDDVSYDPKQALPKFGGVYGDGFHAVFWDGDVRFITKIDERTQRMLLNPQNTEAIPYYQYR